MLTEDSGDQVTCTGARDGSRSHVIHTTRTAPGSPSKTGETCEGFTGHDKRLATLFDTGTTVPPH